MLRALRTVVAGLLGLRDGSASNGDWWETDLILVILFGSAVAGLIAWNSI